MLLSAYLVGSSAWHSLDPGLSSPNVGKSCSHAEIAGVDLAGWMETSAEREIQPTNSTLEAWMEGWQTSFSDGILLDACPDSVVRNNLISVRLCVSSERHWLT